MWSENESGYAMDYEFLPVPHQAGAAAASSIWSSLQQRLWAVARGWS